jgi:uncharacterized protein
MPTVDMLIKPASGLCNMRCKYCFYADVADNREVRSYGLMSEETQKELVKKALASADGYCNFAFQGGEPTLAGLDFFRRQVELEQRYNFRGIRVTNSIQTNGLAIDEEWAKFLAENHFLVGLSLDGPREIHDALRTDPAGAGTFDRVMETVKLFRKHKVDFNILTVISKPVAQNAKKVYSFFRSCNFKYLQFIECLDPFDAQPREYSLTPEDYGQFLKVTFDEYYRDFQRGQYVSVRTFDNYITMLLGNPPESCGMSGVCTAYNLVEANGNVYPCDFYVLDKYLLGNIHTHSFADFAHSNIAAAFVKESLHVDPACRRCKWYRLCHGGCKRCREPFVEGKPGLNRFCEAYQGFFQYAYPKMEQMARAIASRR